MKIWEEGDYIYSKGSQTDQDKLLKVIRKIEDNSKLEWEIL